jgi:hypothetical protein
VGAECVGGGRHEATVLAVAAQANPPPVAGLEIEHIWWWQRGHGELISAVDGGSNCVLEWSRARMPGGGEDSKTTMAVRSILLVPARLAAMPRTRALPL